MIVFAHLIRTEKSDIQILVITKNADKKMV